MSYKLPLTTLLLASLALLALCWQPSSFNSSPASSATLTNASSATQQQTATETGKGETTDKVAPTEFARLVEKLSESGGYFDTDNLISNESSYLHVMGKLRQMQVQGGAYIGVGPDQSFSYLAQIRPRLAFMVDIRRDNLLQHLWFKALFELSRNRLEYLCLILGKPAPARLKEWDQRSLPQLLEYLDQTQAKRELFEAAAKSVRAQVTGYGLTLKPEELSTINRIHTAFFTEGLDLRFTSHGRGPRAYYPTWRDLLLEKDLTGRQANYLVSEDDFQFLKTMQEQHRIIPVVGNLAGDHALAAIAEYLTGRGEKVSAFYTSNVEYYLMRDDGFDRFAENVRKLPRTDKSVIIRSYFGGGWGYRMTQSVPGYYSTQLMQTIESFVQEYGRGGITSYGDLISKHALELK